MITITLDASCTSPNEMKSLRKTTSTLEFMEEGALFPYSSIYEIDEGPEDNSH